MKLIKNIINNNKSRFNFCIELINRFNLSNIAEIGVYKGGFARNILKSCPDIEKYIMIDPWRHLDNWKKPLNKNDQIFETFYQEALLNTDFAKEKRVILKGSTLEVINKIKNNSIDFVYIDGDHTLRGISIDLINIWPKIKINGFIIGDDFFPSLWYHGKDFEPSMVFPFAVYFSEAMNLKIYATPFDHFLIRKEKNSKFEFINLSFKDYNELKLKNLLLQNI